MQEEAAIEEPFLRGLQQDDHDDNISSDHLETIPAGVGHVMKERQAHALQGVSSKCRSLLLYNDKEFRQQLPHNQRKRSRIMLTGPAKSGKSSLAMNFAYSKVISAAPCVCLDTRMCRCIAVTMYRPVVQPTPSTSAGAGPESSTTNIPDNMDDFPLMCRYIDASMESNKCQSENAQASMEWDPQLLKQIRVHRISNVRELLQDLLSLLGKPLQEQPRSGGAIIIDDLDKIVARDVNNVRMSHGNAHWNATTSAILQVGLYYYDVLY
jgi:hypothetical protein